MDSRSTIRVTVTKMMEVRNTCWEAYKSRVSLCFSNYTHTCIQSLPLLLWSHGRNWSHSHNDMELRNTRWVESLYLLLKLRTHREFPFHSHVTHLKRVFLCFPNYTHENRVFLCLSSYTHTQSSTHRVTHIHRVPHIDTSREALFASQVTHT